ncbi:Scr1 family TA system antitoxin-like transcriptional regulator [Streptomyces sp. NPDC051577]|uniref:DUF397 domain-containing protein n=1 Tax=Streptomyces sp. NPDC051577 TaxID=3155166 RepID=UPI00343C656B
MLSKGRAAEVRCFETGIISGLLQTEAYAEALAQSTVRRGTIAPEQARERVAVIAERPEALRRTPGAEWDAQLSRLMDIRGARTGYLLPVAGQRVVATRLRGRDQADTRGHVVTETETPRWFTSSYSDNGGACVEVADALGSAPGAVLVRDSKNPAGPHLSLTREGFAGLLALARHRR